MSYLQSTPILCGDRNNFSNQSGEMEMSWKIEWHGTRATRGLSLILVVVLWSILPPVSAEGGALESSKIPVEWLMESPREWLDGAPLWVVVKARCPGECWAIGPSLSVLFPVVNAGLEFQLLDGERVVARGEFGRERGSLGGMHSTDNVDFRDGRWLRFLVRLRPLKAPVAHGDYKLTVRLSLWLFGRSYMSEHAPPPWMEAPVRIVRPSPQEAKVLEKLGLGGSEWILGPFLEVSHASDRLRAAVEFDNLMRFLAASPVDLSIAALPALSVAGNEFFAPELEAIAFELAGHDPSAESPERERLVGHGLRWLLSSLRYFHGKGIVSDAREWHRALLRQVERRKRGVRQQPAGGEQGEPSS